MITTLLQMAIIVACGAAWRGIKPGGLDADSTRQVLTTVVYYLFLPAMVIEVLWSAQIGLKSLEYTILGIASVMIGILLSWTVCRLLPLSAGQKGAIILSASFANVTYLGLPVLEQTYGAWARSVAIQLDFFAVGPVLFTVGIAIARHYGHDEKGKRFFLAFLNTPPFWAAFLAVLLNIVDCPQPVWLMGVFKKLSSAVIPVMLFSLGLALSWTALRWRNVPYILPVIIIKLGLIPLGIYYLLPYLSLPTQYKSAAALDLAMPSMVLGIVFCDRYRLDSGLYAMAVTVTTLLSMLSLPFWYDKL